jgi:hypothetical protein
MSISERTRNSEVLESFVAYARARPELRFWQALVNWSGLKFLYASDKCNRFEDSTTIAKSLRDVYSWEGRDG